MPISDDLFLAILSLDAYNRGYNSGMGNRDSGLAGTQLGNAIFTLGSDQQAAGIPDGVAAGFYAAAYDTQWATVISYRGTTFNGLPTLNDVLHGWAFAPGDFTEPGMPSPNFL